MREMISIIAVVLLFGLASSSSQVLNPSAAAASDFSGAWKLDRKASTDYKTLSRFDEVTLVISQNSSMLKVVRSGRSKNKVRVQELTYYTDGRGEENQNPLGGQNRRSKTFLSHGDLISEYIVSSWVSSTAEHYKQEARDIWTLSKDRSTLIIRTEVSEGHNLPNLLRGFIKPQRYKKVFSKVN